MMRHRGTICSNAAPTLDELFEDGQAIDDTMIDDLEASYDDRVPEQRVLSVGIECYAGHRGEQTPRALILGDRRIVVEVVDAWLAPDHRYFKLKCGDGNTYLVRHDERSSTWELTMFRAKHLGD